MKVNNPNVVAKRVQLHKQYEKEYQQYISLQANDLCKDIDSTIVKMIINQRYGK